MMMIRTTVRIVATAIALMALLSAVARAQNAQDRPLRPTIRVTGEATVSAKPDEAEIDIGVTSQAQTAQAAAADNATKLEATLTTLRKALGANADIKTISYSVSPNYRYPREGGQPTIAGYIATNIVQVKTGDLKEVGKLIDLATQSGANTIHSLRFTLKDDQAVRNRALAEAAGKARGKATALAAALGVQIVRLLQVEEGAGMGPRPQMHAYAEARMAGAPTPIESGTIDITVTVVLTFEVSQ
jgi:uncharacterized protein YggE